MNSEKLRTAMNADARHGRNEPWKRHVRVLQEYVHELTEALREYEAETGQNCHVSETDFGNTKNKSSTETIKELKPCPFCGGEAIVEGAREEFDSAEESPPYIVYCFDCPAMITPHESRKIAVEQWNSRAPAEELSDVKRQELGYSASRAMLVDVLSETSRMLVFGEWYSADEILSRIRDVLRREEARVE